MRVEQLSELIIRVDASSQIGAGHLMRCLALAQAWQTQGGQVKFITNCKNSELLRRFSDAGFLVVTLKQSHPDPADWETTSQILTAHFGGYVVLDGYHFGPSYQKKIKEMGHTLFVIDDMAHLTHYYADVLLNQNINAEQLVYLCEPYTCLLLGTHYVLLRTEFLSWKKWQREIAPVACKVLVTLGGGDPDNQTLKVIRALQLMDIDGLETVVVVGANNPHFRELQAVAQNSQLAIRLVHNVTNMPKLMAWADVAVSAGGSTCWELAFMGLPNVIVVLAENQKDLAVNLDTIGVAVNLGWYAAVSEMDLAQALTRLIFEPTSRQIMSKAGRILVDGAGRERVVSAIAGKKECQKTDNFYQGDVKTMTKKEQITQAVFDAVDEFNQQLPEKQQLEKSVDATLFGKSGKLDSLGLVTLIVTIEEKIEEEFSIMITLADERAMSQSKSPFRNISALVDYISLLLEEGSGE